MNKEMMKELKNDIEKLIDDYIFLYYENESELLIDIIRNKIKKELKRGLI